MDQHVVRGATAKLQAELAKIGDELATPKTPESSPRARQRKYTPWHSWPEEKKHAVATCYRNCGYSGVMLQYGLDAPPPSTIRG